MLLGICLQLGASFPTYVLKYETDSTMRSDDRGLRNMRGRVPVALLEASPACQAHQEQERATTYARATDLPPEGAHRRDGFQFAVFAHPVCIPSSFRQSTPS